MHDGVKVMNPYSSSKLESTQEGQAINKKASNGDYGGLWMKLKWGGIFRISYLQKSHKAKEDKSNKGMQRIGFCCHIKYLDIDDIEGYFSSTSESTIQRCGSWPYKIIHGIKTHMVLLRTAQRSQKLKIQETMWMNN